MSGHNQQEYVSTLETRIDYLEEVHRATLDTLDLAASLVDLNAPVNGTDAAAKNVANTYVPADVSIVLERLKERASATIPIESSAIFLVNESTHLFYLADCESNETSIFFNKELDFLIENGTFALALREIRPVILASSHQDKKLVLHAISTKTRIRGMFCGVLQGDWHDLPATSLSLLSVIMLSGANLLESLHLHDVLQDVNRDLEQTVGRLQNRIEFENLATAISNSFVNLSAADIDSGISNALEAIGKFSQVDRSYIHILDKNGYKSIFIRQWTAPAVATMSTKTICEADLACFKQTLSRQEVFRATKLKELTENAKAEQQFLDEQHIKSIICVPISGDKSVAGYIGFDSLAAEKIWTDETISLLKMVGHIFVTALQRKWNEESLHERELFLNTVIETAKDAVITVNEEGMISIFNPAAEQIFGHRRDEIAGRPFDKLIAGDFDICKEQLKPCFGKTIELTALHRDRSTFPMELSLSEGKYSGKRIIIAVARDISVRRAAMESMQRAKEAAEAANKTKSEFLANISHEIRTPMNAIIGMTDLLLDTRLSDEQQDYTRVVSGNAKSLLQIINDLLDFSKIEAGKLELDRVEFGLIPCAVWVRDSLLHSATTKGLELTCNVRPDVPSILTGDPAKLRQILLNIVGNAIKFTNKGRVAIDISVAEQTSAETKLHFAVIDDGVGIQPDFKSKLFQPFTQLDGANSRKYGGTGLGLAICKRLVEMMHGEIGVKSEQGCGSTFWFTVVLGNPPIDSATGSDAAKQVAIRAKSSLKKSKRYEGCRLLLVDDNPVNRKLALRILEKLGIKAEPAANGIEAIKALQKFSYDAVLMDIQMPEMDGYEATRVIRDPASAVLDHKIPIIAVTANVMSGDREKCLEAGMDDYVSKPIAIDKLTATLNNHLPRKAKSSPSEETS